MKVKRFFINWLPLILWMGAIFYFSSKPKSQLPQLVPDYIAHFVEYAILAFLFFRLLFKEKIKYAAFLAIAFSILFGISDEVHQYFVPTRQADIKDVAVDVLASFSIVLFLKWLTLKEGFKKLMMKI